VQDASIAANYDFFPLSTGVDPNQAFPDISIGFANSGPNDASRPAPGVIDETRAATEFALPLLQYGVLSATLSFDIDQLANIGPGQLAPFGVLLIRDYAGDGALTFDDFGPIKGNPEPNYGIPFNPVSVALLGTLNVSSTGTYVVDVTAFLRNLYQSGQSFAGFNLALSPTTVADRTLLPGDTTFNLRSESADVGNPWVLAINDAPEPGSIVMLCGGLAVLLWQSIRRAPGIPARRSVRAGL
jgi:hypothetical protein